jgi:phosphohistidine phosphatase
MYLYLVQHGDAKREEEDPARGLTKKGIEDVTCVAACVQKMSVNVKWIMHSSKTRAMQTAIIFADHLNPEKGVSESD